MHVCLGELVLVSALEELYEICRKCRRGLVGKYGVGRVIARPFIGANGNYTRTTNRHDFSLVPPGKTMLNYIKDKGMATIALGKIFDIFAGDGISEHVYTSGNEDGINKILEFMKKDFTGLLFANLVDYDMLYGHRRDIDGYANAVAFFDSRLPEIIAELRENDILIITADHGCDPSYSRTTDHTREYTPLLVYGKKLEPKNLGTRKSFADIGASILKYLEITGEIAGDAFL